MWRKVKLQRVLEGTEGLLRVCHGSRLTAAPSRSSSTSPEPSEELVQHYLLAMRLVPSAVVVVTTGDGSQKRGVTCSSFTSVSLHPPIISFTMQLHSRMHELLQSTQRFAANVLSEQQANYSVHFSRPFQDSSDVRQFDSIPHHSSGPLGVPILNDCSSVLQCSTHDMHTVGDHHVWYGKVLHASQNDTPPLLYYDRSYRSIGDETFIRAFETATLGYEEWTHEAHLRMAWNYLTLHGKDKATPIIREGIRNYIDQNYGKVKNMYNETITLFFIHMVHTAIELVSGEQTSTKQ
jgi:flavin reductase (DIM6/NTAB) family NADH-FMN oxidoreductase RutF